MLRSTYWVFLSFDGTSTSTDLLTMSNRFLLLFLKGSGAADALIIRSRTNYLT
jgi:hypothetical protein